MKKNNVSDEIKPYTQLSSYEKFVFLLFLDKKNFINQFHFVIQDFKDSAKSFIKDDGTPIYFDLLNSTQEIKDMAQQEFSLQTKKLEWFAYKFGFSSYPFLLNCFKYLISKNILPPTKFSKNNIIDIKKHNNYLKYLKSYLIHIQTNGFPEDFNGQNRDIVNFMLDPRSAGRVIKKIEPILNAYKIYKKLADETELNIPVD